MKVIQTKSDSNSEEVELDKYKLDIAKYRTMLRFKINTIGESITNLSNSVSKNPE